MSDIPHQDLTDNFVHLIPDLELEMTHLEAAHLNTFAHHISRQLASATPKASGDRYEIVLNFDHAGLIIIQNSANQAAFASKRIFDRSGLEDMAVSPTDRFHSPDLKVRIIDNLPGDIQE